ncbi:hypothetical protein OLX02_05435 [Novosphingobium sp. KCTC 2891]|uniref:hypothetical protein n=1 Tax=Novosphingobium sp. KCTC 2891 TaxID=2989730 RepID=UPI00222191D0|nr:hypothetical protein [Novosphingobium sp. KCTC 2891]MCW1382257.1 hypothetical protein [Novosphingobium sp. KCTC 2891]
MVRLPQHGAIFPRPAPQSARVNAWGAQWKYLPRRAAGLVRNSLRDGLKKIRPV